MARTRVKTDAAPLVPQSADEVSNLIATIADSARRRDAIEALMNADLAEIKQDYEARAKVHTVVIEELTRAVQTWCEANRANLTRDGKRKFYRFAAGEVQWRSRPASIRLSKIADVLKALRKAGLERFIRVKVEVDKEAMLKEPDTAAGVKGVTVAGGEDFVIKPFGGELEEIAK